MYERAIKFTKGQSIRRILFGLALSMYCLDRLYRDRGSEQKLPLLCGLMLGLAGVISFSCNLIELRWKRTSNALFALSGFLFIVATGIGAGYELSKPELWEKAKSAYEAARRIVGPPITVLSTLTLAAFGYGLFVLKAKKLLLYSRLEMIFAILSCYTAVRKSVQLSLGTMSVIGAAAYLMVRGFENRKKALQDKMNETKTAKI